MASGRFQFLTFMDPDYPKQLLEVHQFPPVLFAKGTMQSGEVGVSVVGSRSSSERRLANAREISRDLTRSGIAVISGLAAGIDTAAHLSALESGGRTVAVIGTGNQQVLSCRAYGRATIIVEAGEQSGARIQARLAVAHGRPVVLMDSVVRGTNCGSKLRGQPGVFVADSPGQAVELIERLCTTTRE